VAPFLQEASVMDGAREVLSALRLGWSVAEMRGRNRPGGPSGDIVGMPDQIDHPLPLRIERSKTELRIEVQSVLAELAQELRVDDSADGTSLTRALGDAAKLLSHVRAAKAADALQLALDLLQAPSAGQVGQDEPSPPDLALGVLRQGLATQQAVVVRRQQAVAAANRALAGARQHQPPDAPHPDQAQAEAESARTAAETAVQLEGACRDGEAAGAAALEQVIGALGQAIAASPQTAAEAGIECIRQCQQGFADAGRRPWADLAELIWQFDARAQDRLAAISESQAIGYQLGRGLADTYWALDPGQPSGSASWGFLLGERRCDELSRQTGRLAAYMGEYTAPAIAGSLEVWKAVVRTPAWLGHPYQADLALYGQIRRWFELIVLEQDPTTLVGPAAVMKNYHTLNRALKLFWPELVATIVGVGFLVTLLFLVNVGAAGWAKTLSAILAVVGFSLAGLTGTLKNSAQALLKRLRQDAYTDLVAQAVLIAPPPPSKSAVQDAIRRRGLTPATPN
jgi:hypothetical protein